MVLIIGIILILTLPIYGTWSIVSACRQREKGTNALRFAFRGILSITISIYLVACLWAGLRSLGSFTRCKENLGRKIYISAVLYAEQHRGCELPAGWTGMEKEPHCEGSGNPQSYHYFHIHSSHIGNNSKQWVACCPKAHKKYHWALWKPFKCKDRVIVYSDGHVNEITEIEFNKYSLRKSASEAPEDTSIASRQNSNKD